MENIFSILPVVSLNEPLLKYSMLHFTVNCVLSVVYKVVKTNSKIYPYSGSVQTDFLLTTCNSKFSSY
jgi:hypothetical protein